MKLLRRVGTFVVEMFATWSGKITGGFTALFVAWQYTGGHIPVKLGWGIIMAGIGVAAFELWNRQVNETEQAKREFEEYKRRNNNPMVELQFLPTNQKQTEGDLLFSLCSSLPAYNVQIQPIVMPKSTATFPEVTRLPVGTWQEIKPNIEPVVDLKYRHDFIVMLHNQPEEFMLAHRAPECEGKIDPIVAIPIEITYSNQTGKEWFVTKMEVLYDFNPLRDYVDTRLIESGLLPGKPQSHVLKTARS